LAECDFKELTEDYETRVKGYFHVIAKRKALPWIPREWDELADNYKEEELISFDSVEEAEQIAIAARATPSREFGIIHSGRQDSGAYRRIRSQCSIPGSILGAR